MSVFARLMEYRDEMFLEKNNHRQFYFSDDSDRRISGLAGNKA